MSAPPDYDAHSIDSTQLRPYLQLPHLLSLTWLAYPILSLIFVVFRIQISLSSADADIANAKKDVVAGCLAAQKAATAAASMPRFMAIATNEQFAAAVNDSMNAARATLILALTVMEAIINFIVDTYRSTFLCFLELVIQGGLAILAGAVQELNVVVGAAASGIRTAIQDTVSGADKILQDAASVVSKFGVNINPSIPVPDLSALENVTLPQSFTDAINNLNSTIPTFTELKQLIDQFVDTPFEVLKADINETFSGISFNSSVLAVPELNTLSFCSDLDTSFIDDLGHDLVQVAKIGTVIIIILIFVLIGLNCLLEWYKWRCQRRHLEYTRQAWTSDPTLFNKTATGGLPNITLSDHNLLMLQADGAHPLLTRIANRISATLRLSPSKHINLRWFLHYVFHPPALACFLIGFFGLLSVELQLLAMRPLVAKFSAQAQSTATDFSNTIATSINASMFNQSAEYANSVNTHIDSIQGTINDGLFGWVNTTTTTLNSTIEAVYEDIQNAVNKVFNGTILDAPVQIFIKCLIGSKIEAIENALTFLHNNLHIDMPRVNETVLVLSPASVNEATQPIAAAVVGDNDDGSDGVVGRLVNSYEATLKKERLMFAIFMGIWFVVVLMGVSVILWHSYGRPYFEARRKRRWAQGLHSVPVAEEKGYGAASGAMSNSNEFPNYTPLPSPKLGGSFNPFRFKNGSTDSVEKANNRSWDSFFDKSSKAPITTREISKPMKLVSSRQRDHEVFVGDRNAPSPPPAVAPWDEPQEERRTTKWFARFAGLLTRNRGEDAGPAVEPYPAFSPNPEAGPRTRPTLHITVDRPASDLPSESGFPTDRSRWSVSPENTTRAPIKPWSGLMSPTTGGPRRHKHKPSVPDSVGGNNTYSLDLSMGPPSMQPTPLAMPLHSGFNVPRKQPIAPHHPAVVYPPVTPIASRHHRRSMSNPQQPVNDARNPFSDANRLTVPAGEPSPATPVTRLLTTTHARCSSSVDPFVTPFDDEHRVTIVNSGPGARKSIPTNPFTGVAL
ncbi:plasma membrane fusion protein PRM1 [Roridomyces roridus]|uniref:Plasma membrane fusion protein PRM1 n=1 Tax=Roridomyces roridus TaxID=1738132 RepID=A0AAD7CED8_9AGAR|nr:plasma membrane fusion protein PRM1 [Roridomyces roridus]